MNLPQLHVYGKNDVQKRIKNRNGENKIGDFVGCSNQEEWQHDLAQHPAQFVLLGLPEDIGVRANCGVGGAYSAWEVALNSFLNIQENQFLSGKQFFVLGHIDFEEYLKEAHNLDSANSEDLAKLRKLTAQIDQSVTSTIEAIVGAGKVPVVIGGGHNNSYGCIKGSSLAIKEKVSVLNLDPHADFRSLEGRHSGNGFRYAFEEGFVHEYFILGLHESYNSSSMLKTIQETPQVDYCTFESIFIREEVDFRAVTDQFLSKTQHQHLGIEIDLDCIEGVPVSAYTPSGITVNSARKFVSWAAKANQVAYLHLSEGAPVLGHDLSAAHVGKTIAYLIADFAKSAQKAKSH